MGRRRRRPEDEVGAVPGAGRQFDRAEAVLPAEAHRLGASGVTGLEGGLGHHRAPLSSSSRRRPLSTDRPPSSLMKKRDRLTVTPVASWASSKRRASLPSISWRTLLVATDLLTPGSPPLPDVAAGEQRGCRWRGRRPASRLRWRRWRRAGTTVVMPVWAQAAVHWPAEAAFAGFQQGVTDGGGWWFQDHRRCVGVTGVDAAGRSVVDLPLRQTSAASQTGGLVEPTPLAAVRVPADAAGEAGGVDAADHQAASPSASVSPVRLAGQREAVAPDVDALRRRRPGRCW